MEIFWIEKGKRQGPLPVVEIISKLQRKELSADTKGWHTGCSAWAPLKNLPALAQYFTARPDEDDFDDNGNDELAEPTPRQSTLNDTITATLSANEVTEIEKKPIKVVVVPPPGIRFWARMVDLSLFFFLCAIFIPLFDIPYNRAYLAWAMPLMIPLEALCLHLFGTTPGKALLNIKVCTLEEKSLPIGLSLLRTIYVYILGLGFLQFPFCPLLTLISWWMTRRNGIAPWDMKLKIAVYVTRRIPMFQVIIAALAIVLFVNFTGKCMEPWQDDILREFPESVQDAFKNK